MSTVNIENSVLISSAMLLEKWNSWSRIYIKNVSELHRPIFWMVTSGTPLMCIAVAPPDRKLWELTRSGRMFIRCRFSAETATRRAFVIVRGRTVRSCPLVVKYEPSWRVVSVEYRWTCLSRWINACTGHDRTAVWVFGMALCDTRCAFLPDFWLIICNVAPVHRQSSSFSGREASNNLLCSQRYTSQWQNRIVCLRSEGGENVYSPGRRRK